MCIRDRYHPEFKSRPLRPQPLFREFVAAAVRRVHDRVPEGEPEVRAAGDRDGAEAEAGDRAAS